MPVIDIHAHWLPRPYREAMAAGASDWLGVDQVAGEFGLKGFRLGVDERLADMDAMGVDFQVLSPQVGMYQYTQAPEDGLAVARATNDDIAAVVAENPTKFAGLGTLPMQDVGLAINELDRVLGDLGFAGVELGHQVDGTTLESPKYLPFWEHIEKTGAVVLFHQGFADTHFSVPQYHLSNSIGNLAEHAMTFGLLVGSGLLDRFPGLELIFGHGGGYITFGASRMDKASGYFVGDHRGAYVPDFLSQPRYQGVNQKAPSAYVSQVNYDSCTYSEATLRFILDAAGADRVMFGTDCPAPMLLTDGARWISDSAEFTEEEKAAILYKNAARMFRIDIREP
jgi:aminocarboxymuconate-semialdehyde decarboxylase